MQKQQPKLKITTASLKYEAVLEENEPIVIFDGPQLFPKSPRTLFHADSLAAAQKALCGLGAVFKP